MKKKLLAMLIGATAATACAFALAGCATTPEQPPHNHTFYQRVIEQKYLCEEATCTHPAYYYLSCECGEKGTETFEHGEALAHNIVNNVCTECPYPLTVKNNMVLGIASTDITEVVIPEGVEAINSNAFYNCSRLTKVVIPDSVTYIGRDAFLGCPIETATIPAFASSYLEHNTLKTVTITSGDTVEPFAGCTLLESITLADSIKIIGIYAFTDCTALKSITIPDGVTYIDECAFSGCKALTSIKLPVSVTYIGKEAFYGCYLAESINIPDGVTSIGERAFCACYSLTEIDIPGSVTSIGTMAFTSCTSVKSINIGSGVTSIEDDAFYSCFELESIYIPNSVTSIGERAFTYCRSLTDINFDGTKAEWAAIKKGYRWQLNSGNFTVHCTDGKLDKNGNEIA